PRRTGRDRLLGHLELRIGVDPLRTWHERGHVGGRGQVEEDGHTAHETGDREKLEEAKVTQCKSQRDRPEQRRAYQVARDQDPAPAKPIHPDAGEQPERRPGERPGSGEDANWHGGGAGDERQDSYEVGKAWFARARAAASSRLLTALRTLVGTDGPRWFLLLGMVHEAGGAHDVERLLSHIRGSRPEDVITALVGGRLPALRTGEGQSLVKSALAGEAK